MFGNIIIYSCRLSSLCEEKEIKDREKNDRDKSRQDKKLSDARVQTR
jgi:hypothetical protein